MDQLTQQQIQQQLEQQGQQSQDNPQAQQQKQREEEERRQAAEEQRQQMLSAVLTPEARERLSNISLVKPERARAVEDRLLQSFRASRGAMSKVSEQQLVNMLTQSSANSAKKTITIKRKIDSDDDWGISDEEEDDDSDDSDDSEE